MLIYLTVNLFQQNIMSFMEEKFDDFNQNRLKDKHHWETQISQLKKRKTNNHSFKYKSNKLQFEFLSDLNDSIDDAKELLEAGSKRRLKSELDDISMKISKRQKVIRLADRSIAGWDTVNEYLTDELASGSEDDKKMRQAESRAITKKNRESKRKSNSTASTSRSYTSTYQSSYPSSYQTTYPSSYQPSWSGQGHNTMVPQFAPLQVPQLFHQSKMVPAPQPFLGQGAFGAGVIPPQQAIRSATPSNVCFECGIPGHWKQNCPTKGK